MNQNAIDSLPVVGTVICLPVRDLDASRVFYENVFALPELTVEEEIIVIELPGLSLFLIQEETFDSYTRKAGRGVSYPGAKDGTGVIFSCAITSAKTLNAMLTAATTHGGTMAQEAATDPEMGLYMGYFFDPDGHHWELAHSNRG